jgi:hypothetical protein
MEEGNTSKVTYDTIFVVSISGFLAKQTLEEGKWTSKAAADIIRSQLIEDNHEEKALEVRQMLNRNIKVFAYGIR